MCAIRRTRKPVNFIPAFGKNWNIHLQTHEDLLFVIDEFNFYAAEAFSKEESYYTQSVEESIKQAGANVFGERGVDYSAGLSGVRHFEARPAAPDRPVLDRGPRVPPHVVRRRQLLLCLGLAGWVQRPHLHDRRRVRSNPKPFEVSRWWLPGQWSAGGEKPTWAKGDRVALHHAIVAKDIAYGSWRDGG